VDLLAFTAFPEADLVLQSPGETHSGIRRLTDLGAVLAEQHDE
jgi:hypothetical protein